MALFDSKKDIPEIPLWLNSPIADNFFFLALSTFAGNIINLRAQQESNQQALLDSEKTTITSNNYTGYSGSLTAIADDSYTTLVTDFYADFMVVASIPTSGVEAIFFLANWIGVTNNRADTQLGLYTDGSGGFESFKGNHTSPLPESGVNFVYGSSGTAFFNASSGITSDSGAVHYWVAFGEQT